jgi:hypothetical protein
MHSQKLTLKYTLFNGYFYYHIKIKCILKSACCIFFNMNQMVQKYAAINNQLN